MKNISIVKEKKGKMSKKRLLIMVLTLTGIMAIVSGLIILLVLGNSTPPKKLTLELLLGMLKKQ